MWIAIHVSNGAFPQSREEQNGMGACVKDCNHSQRKEPQRSHLELLYLLIHIITNVHNINAFLLAC